jgi:transcription antitermination factor NusG
VWNVVHTNPNHEAQVAKFLGLHAIEVYAPQFALPARTRPGSVRDRRRRFVFPGYLFLRVPHQFGRWDLVHWAPGVRRVLSDNGSPATVSDAVVDRIRERLVEETTVRKRLPFTPGQPVVIERGPLAMVDAIFDKALNTSERVQVLVHLLGRLMTVAVDAAILRAAG